MDQLFPIFEQSPIVLAVFATAWWLRRDHREEMEEMRKFYDDKNTRLERRLDVLESAEIRRTVQADATDKKLAEHEEAIKRRPRYESVKRIAAEQKRKEEGQG